MTNKPLRILEVNKFYPPDIGGIETVVQTVSEGLKDRAEISVLTCQRKGKRRDDVVNGVSVLRAHTIGTYFSCPLSFSFFGLFRKRCKTADVVEFHMPFPPGDLACLLSGYRGRVVLAWHSDVVKQKKLLFFYQPILKAFLRRADAIIVATKGHIDSSLYLPEFREKCHIIPYALRISDYDNAPLTPVLSDRLCDHRAKKVFFAGRLVYYKGVSVLLEAFAKVHDCELFLAGDGELSAPLQEQAKALGIANRVHFFGRLSDADLKSAFADCDLFVLPSVQNSEAFGIVQLEAMVYAKPVINTDLPTGVPCVSLHEQTGLTVPVGNAPALADAIQRLVDDDALRARYGAAARQRVLDEFELTGMLDRVYAVLADPLKGSDPA